jgi:hypothetical protein
LSEVKGYWCETFNRHEVATATNEPGAVFQSSGTMSDDFIRVDNN